MSDEPSSLKLVGTLGVAGILSGFLLVGAYLVTLPRIQENKATALRAAVLRLLPGTATMVPYVVRDGKLAVFTPKGNELPQEEAVYGGYDASKQLLGYAVPAEGAGFADTIRVLYGFDPQRKIVVGVEVLDTKETPGLGDKIIDDPEFHASMKKLAVEPDIVLQKRGKPQAPNEVDAISGATISSAAIVKILNQSTQRWLPLLAAPQPSAAADTVPGATAARGGN